MKPKILSAQEYERALLIRDLTDPLQGTHGMQLLVDRICDALVETWRCPVLRHRAHPAVSIDDNYDRLHYPTGAATRDARYTRYVSESTVLRTHTSAMIPPLLRRIATDPPDDVVLVSPGIVYRRDRIDRTHAGEPHQLDLWRVAACPLGPKDLAAMIHTVVDAALPGVAYRCNATNHPYTEEGLEIEISTGGKWLEIGECGLALPAILEEAGLSTAKWSGLAMGIGLDRLLIAIKGVDDIRLLRSEDPRIAVQMLDLSKYRPVSNQPPIRRDLSVAADQETTPEEIGDRIREALCERANGLESVEILAETPHAALPRAAIERLGMHSGQKNVLARIVIRDLTRTLTDKEANDLRDEVYAALHEGTVWHWASRGAPRPG